MGAGYVFISSPTIAEGNSGTKIMTFVVQRGGGTDAFDVDFTTMDGIARVVDGDYVAASGTLHFDAGVETRTISVVVNGDSKTELNEDFVVQLSNPSNGAVLQSNYGSGLLNAGLGIGTILNDENPSGAGLVWISDVSIVEGNSGSRGVLFAVQRTGGTTPFQVNFTTVDRGASSASGDYVPTSGTLQFAAGETIKYIPVAIGSDVQFEPTECFGVQLSGATGGAILGQGQGYLPSFLGNTSSDVVALGTIVNDDAGAQGHLVSISGSSIVEGDSGNKTLVFTVTRTGGTSAFDVDYQTYPGNAMPGEDFTNKSGTLHFAANQMTATISITVKGDTLPEPDEFFGVQLSNATNGVSVDLYTGGGTGMIENDDGFGAGLVWIDNAVVVEGNSGNRTMTFTVNRTGGTGAFSLDYASYGNFGPNGATAGVDFETKSGTLVFAEGQTSRTISLKVYGNTAVEGNETLSVSLDNPSNHAIIVNGSASGVILDDDGLTGPGTVWIEDSSVAEGDGEARIMTFTIVRAGGTGAFDVNYTTADYYGKSAAAGDFVDTSGLLHFGTGVTSQTVSVTVLGNLEHDPGRAGALAMILSNATNGAVISRGIALGQVVDDDPLSASNTVRIGSASVTEGNDGTKVMTFTVSRTGTTAFSVNYATADGTATVADGDYVAASGTLQFAAGVMSRTLSVTIKGDVKGEADEYLFVNLSAATGGMTIGPDPGVGTILNDEPTVLSDKGNKLAALTPAALAALPAQGIQRLDATDDKLTLSLAQVQALGPVQLTAGDDVVLRDTGAALAALSSPQLADLAARGVDRIDVADRLVSFSLAQLEALAGLLLTAGDVITVLDTGASLAALAPSAFGDLAARAIDRIDVSDNLLALGVAQYAALGTLKLTGADTVTLRDSGAALAGFTAGQIGQLARKQVDAIDASDDALTLSSAQYLALGPIDLAMADLVTLADTSTRIGALTATDFARLDNDGIDRIDASDNKLALTVAQYKGLGTTLLTAADVVTLRDTGAAIASLTPSQLGALAGRGIDRIDATDNAITFTANQRNALGAVTIAADDVVTIA